MNKEALRQAIDDLKPESLQELSKFVDYLRYKEALKQIEALFVPVHQTIKDAGMTPDEIKLFVDEVT